jgi:hypothetical protein
VAWNRTRSSDGRFFGLARAGRRRFPDRRGAGGADGRGLAAALEPERFADATPAAFFELDRG